MAAWQIRTAACIHSSISMGLLLDTQNCGLCMRRECPERFPRHRIQRKSLVNDPGMHHDTCVTHGPWCMSASLNRGGAENVPGIPGACATQNFTYLARGPCGLWLLPIQASNCLYQAEYFYSWVNITNSRYYRDYSWWSVVLRSLGSR